MVERISYGELNLSEREFLKSTPRFWKRKLEGLRSAQRQEYRNQWIIARWTVAAAMTPHLRAPIKPTKLLRFPWEESEHDDIVATVSKHKDIFAKLTPPAKA
jgi:hypothetical protein